MKTVLILLAVTMLQGCATYTEALLASRTPQARLDAIEWQILRAQYELRKGK